MKNKKVLKKCDEFEKNIILEKEKRNIVNDIDNKISDEFIVFNDKIKDIIKKPSKNVNGAILSGFSLLQSAYKIHALGTQRRIANSQPLPPKKEYPKGKIIEGENTEIVISKNCTITLKSVNPKICWITNTVAGITDEELKNRSKK